LDWQRAISRRFVEAVRGADWSEPERAKQAVVEAMASYLHTRSWTTSASLACSRSKVPMIVRELAGDLAAGAAGEPDASIARGQPDPHPGAALSLAAIAAMIRTDGTVKEPAQETAKAAPPIWM
jgi:hypothetical protein